MVRPATPTQDGDGVNMKEVEEAFVAAAASYGARDDRVIARSLRAAVGRRDLRVSPGTRVSDAIPAPA